MANPQYVIIVNAGSTGSRIHVFQSHNADRRRVQQIFTEETEFPPGDCEGGIQCSANQGQTNGHLHPLLTAAFNHLENAVPAATPQNTVFYLLATGGMRRLGQVAHDRILDEVRVLLATAEFVARLGNVPASNIRTITGQQEGWFAWSDLNYGRGAGVNPAGILELGGASFQYAFIVRNDADGDPDVPNDQLNRLGLMCTNPQNLAASENVYSHQWPMGADDLMNIVFINGKTSAGNPHEAPCLPDGEQFNIPRPEDQVLRNRGNGLYQECGDLLRNPEVVPPIPGFNDLPVNADTTRFAPLAKFQYTYKFFSNTDDVKDSSGPKYNPKGVYDPIVFGNAVRPYCQGRWAKMVWAHGDQFKSVRCLDAAWMEKTFDLAHNTSGPAFDFSLQAEWPQGAAALVRNHGGMLKLCNADAEELPVYTPPALQDLDGNANVSFAQILHWQNLDLPKPAQPASDTLTLFVPLWTYYLPFAVLFILITHRLVQRSRDKKALEKIVLPDLEKNALTGGEKARDMEDRGLGGNYKD